MAARSSFQAHAADIQDRDGAGPLLQASRTRWPLVELAYADATYQGPRVAAANPTRLENVRKPEGQVGFTVHARGWVVERFFAWINRNAAWPRTSRQPSPRQKPSYTPLPQCCCYDLWHANEPIRDRLSG